MSRNWLKLLCATIMLSILSSCIGTEIDLSIVTKDLGLLQTRLQDYRYKEPWDTIQLIAGVSGDTIRFLIEQDKQDPENKKMIIEVYPELGRLLSHYPIQTPLAAIDPPVPLAPESIPPNGNFETFFDQKMSEIRSDNKVYVVERFFESKIPHYCIDECACIAKEIAIAMKSELGIDTAKIWVKGGTDFGVELIDREKSTNWMYHVALAIPLESEIWIFDPLVFQDNRLHSLRSWHSKFVRKNKITFSFLP